VTVSEFASAKINLALHVTGQRDDGYHLLDSLVVFADAGDRLQFSPADEDSLTLSGLFGSSLPVDAAPKGGNLVLRARDALRAVAIARGKAAPAVHIHLEKDLPVASGIGGGSADAAAALRGLNRLWDLGLDTATLCAIGLPLGADVPMCVESRPLVARGIGEDLRLLTDFPLLHLLLVNPLAEVSTPVIFRNLASKTNPPLALPEEGAAFADWIALLAAARNDLQPPACAIEPKITDVLAKLSATDPFLTRMSGSGATCFGLYRTAAECLRAARQLEAEHPEWYIQPAATGTETDDGTN
jgi:4-diphosphocytidyl-2-C-methyl-D-erythritol kinase